MKLRRNVNKMCVSVSETMPGIFLLLSTLLSNIVNSATRPNIVFILADDIGVNDVSWNKNTSTTPTLGSLADEGVILDSAYTLPVCTPSRAALMTGVYPFKFGFQRGFGRNVPEGLPLKIKLLPEYLSGEGYSTHGFGKWHLGFCSDSYHPLNRGFDTFQGPLVGDESDNDIHAPSLFYVNEALRTVRDLPASKPFFVFLSLLTKPYYVPEDKKKKNKQKAKSVNRDRRIKIKKMDRAVSRLVDGLKTGKNYKNTVIIFISDNGGRFIEDSRARSNPNFPLKGHKNTIYEGGTKVPGFIHSPLLEKRGYRYQGLLHMVDFLPTLVNLASETGTGSEVEGESLLSWDGVNQWEAVSKNLQSPRKVMVYNIDDLSLPPILAGPVIYEKFQIGIRDEQYKLIWGQPGMLHRGHHKAGNSNGPLENEMQTLELYDLKDDPEETTNLALFRDHHETIEKLQRLALQYYPDMVPPIFQSGPVPSEEVDTIIRTGWTGRESDTIISSGRLYKWCRAVLSTSCSPPETGLVEYNINTTLVQVFDGTFLHKQSLCLTELEPI